MHEWSFKAFVLNTTEHADTVERLLNAYRAQTPTPIHVHLVGGGPIHSDRARITAAEETPPGSGTWHFDFQEWPEDA